METIKVTKCGECPFLVRDEEYGDYCNKEYTTTWAVVPIVDFRHTNEHCPIKGKTIKIEVE